MPSYTQSSHLLSVQTPVGKDVLLLTGFSGSEGLSRLFRYQLDMVSQKPDIAAKDIVGKPVSWAVQQIDKEPRYFHGIVSRFSAGGQYIQKMRSYQAEVVPWLWFLTRTSDCRIFQEKNAKDIIKAVFDNLGFTDYDLSKLQGNYPAWEYCVQYRETAFNFVSRLMEQVGICYFFEHSQSKHKLFLADSPGAFPDCKENEVRYSAGSLSENHVSSWEHGYEFRSGKWAHTDYNFETPSTGLLADTTTKIDIPDMKKFELFDYPGDYRARGQGDALVKLRMQEEEAGHEIVHGAGACCTFTPGGKFTLAEHEIEAESGKSYVITAIHHSARDDSYTNQDGEAEYSNQFSCIPASIPYRAPRSTPKPLVNGPQTAVVVGPSGEEIYTDKYGRIKVQFFWDRVGSKNEKSSCWIRVAEVWAGKGWGAVSTPRIGQEVVIDFLEGDPDRPLVTGRVYNAEQMPPYPLPGGQNISGLKSNSTKGGGGYNEFSMDDSKGKELITVHAQFDMDAVIEHDDRQTVHNDRTITVDHDETSHIKNNRTETVDSNETITIGKDRTETVKGNETISVSMNRTETVSQNESVTVVMTRTHMVGINDSLNVGAAQEVTVGAARAVTVIGGQTLSVGRTHKESVGGDHTESVKGNHKSEVGKDQTVSVKQNDTLDVGKILKVTAGDEIVLTTGQSSIHMKKDGTITIKGKAITIEATQKIEEKAMNITSEASSKHMTQGAMVNAEASGVHTIKGSLVKIN